MNKLLDVVWLEAQVRLVLGHTPESVAECLEGFRKLFQGEVRQAFYALAWQKTRGERVELPQPHSPTQGLVLQAFQVALDKTVAHLEATHPERVQAARLARVQGGTPALEPPTIWARRVVSQLGREPRTLDEAREGLDRVLAELGRRELEALAWTRLAGDRVYLPKPRPDRVEQWVYTALLEHLDGLVERLKAAYPERVRALREAAQHKRKTHQPEQASQAQRPLRYLKFGGSQVPVYPKDLLPRPLQPVFRTHARELRLSNGRVLRLKTPPVFQGWQGDSRWWNRPDAKPAEALEWLQGLLAGREFVFEPAEDGWERPAESAHFPMEEPAGVIAVGTRGYALYRDPHTHQDWFKAEAFAWS